MTEVATRLWREADKAFVYESWLESFRVSHAAGPFPMRMYRKVYTETLDALIARPGAQVLVACSPDDDDQVLGFVCHERRATVPPIVHYLYVKQLFRRERVATILMTAADIPTGRRFIYTFKTPVATRIAEHWAGAIFDPLVARFAPKDA